VTVIDANLLLYAYDANSTAHTSARTWLERILSEPAPVGLPYLSICAFLRISTHAGIAGRKVTLDKALTIVDSWLAQPNVRLLSHGDSSWPLLRKTISAGQARGPMVTDAELAAITIEAGGILCTTDRDFARFPGLRWMNPLSD
jgi:uncharacterized protein